MMLTAQVTGRYTVELLVVDSVGALLILPGITITVYAPLVLTSPVLSITALWPFSVALAVQGGRSPYNVSVSNDTLCGLGTVVVAGLALQGNATGTPARPGPTTCSFAVTATDARNTSTTIILQATISPALSLSIVDFVNKASITVNRSFTSTMRCTAVGGRGPVRYSVLGALPDGLEISDTSGIISGWCIVFRQTTTTEYDLIALNLRLHPHPHPT